WEGLQDKNEDESERLTPDRFITKSIQDAQISNTLFAKKEEYEQDERNLKTSKQSRENTTQLRNQNKEDRTQKVASFDFKVNGLSVNENGVLTAKVEGKPIVTLKDLNEADQYRVFCEILMVNNVAPLRMILFQSGYACNKDYQKIICEMARKHNHTVIIESFESLEGEGCLYMKDGISYDTPQVEDKESSETQVEGKPNW
ncbi:hypothetical protein KA005_08170, partial [bacterium]|nr:hypothetical protein [bacterium]